MSIAEEIKQLKELLDEGILTQEEFDEQKNALLKNNIQSDSVENSESETAQEAVEQTQNESNENDHETDTETEEQTGESN